MATDKKGFILYADLIGMVEKLPDEIAGKLLKLILAYVNDLNPSVDDLVLQIAFEPIRIQLKRDLIKYEDKRQRLSDSGRKGMEKRWNKDKEVITNDKVVIKPISSITVNDNVSVNDNVNVILLEKETKHIYPFRQNLIDFGFNKCLVDDWLKVRKTKKATNTETAFKKFIIEVKKTKTEINSVMELCVEKSWSGFKSEWLNNLKTETNGKTGNTINAITNILEQRGIIDSANI